MSAVWNPPARTSKDEGWHPLDRDHVLTSPDAFGVCEIANSKGERILLVHGVIREELVRVLEDPRAPAHDARTFRAHVVLTDRQARDLAGDILRAYDELGWPLPAVGAFGKPASRPPVGPRGTPGPDGAD